MTFPPEPLEGAAQGWDTAPCSLVALERTGRVAAANERFLAHTGYTREAMIGTVQWSALLSPGSRLFFEAQIAPVLALGGSVSEVMIDLLRADGRRLPALMNAETTTDGRFTRIALMTVPDRREYENELVRAREHAERANEANTQALQRLELLAQVNAALAGSNDVEAAALRLATVLVERVADWCLVYVMDPDIQQHDVRDPGVRNLHRVETGRAGAPRRWSAAHHDPALLGALHRLAELLPQHALPRSALAQVLAGGPAILLEQVSADHQRDSTDNDEVRGLYAELDLASAIVIPSMARGRQVAAIIAVRGHSRPAFTGADLADLSDLGARTGIVIDNLRRYAREHNDSLALQQALLTTPPVGPDVSIVSRYVPASIGAEIGGDWYDSFHQPDGTTVIVIGDVVGHDIRAAAAMGQLRGIIRTIGHTQAGSPADTLARADRAARGLGVGVLASAVVARLEPLAGPGSGRWTMRWSNAGHPPPILISGLDVTLLERRADPILGVVPDRARHDHSVALGPGDTVVFYTDGLIERREEDIDMGTARLLDTLSTYREYPLDKLCDLVLDRQDTSRRDDIALLFVRIRPDGAEV